MNRTVIIAESSPPIAREIAEVFTEEGFQVLGVFHDGLSAMRSAGECSPGIVSLDLILPRLSGLQLACQLAKLPIPPVILAISAVNSKERLTQAKEAGVQCYMLKAFDREKLRVIIRSRAGAYIQQAAG